MLRLIAILVAACALVLSLRAVYRQHVADSTRPQLSTPDDSDYYMTDAVIYQMDKQGHLAYRATIARTLHFADDSARLKNIHVHYLAGTKTYWDLSAARGRVPPGKHAIYLYDGVKAHHPRPDGRVVRLTTTHAWIHPDSNRIDSQAPVKAIEPGRTLEGRGMQADLNKDTLRLLKNVHVTYQP